MKELWIVPVPERDPPACRLLEWTQEQLQRDLARYERQNRTRLERDPVDGSYCLMSRPLSEVDRILYQTNPYSNTLLLPIWMPELWQLTEQKKRKERT